MHSDIETGISRGNLRDIFSIVDEGCLLGGWAVYLNVNERFRADNGSDYIGSRDIDVGFLLDHDIPLEDSEFARVFGALRVSGFRGQAFRMYRGYDRETGLELSPEEAGAKPFFEVLNLYVDLVVDRVPASFVEMFGFSPIDEPLLTEVYSNGWFVDVEWEGVRLRIVDPVFLVCMKLRSVVGRTRDHKRVKGISDLYALMWYGGVPLRELGAKVSSIIGKANIRGPLDGIELAEIGSAAGVLGIDAGQVSRVFSQFKRV